MPASGMPASGLEVRSTSSSVTVVGVVTTVVPRTCPSVTLCCGVPLKLGLALSRACHVSVDDLSRIEESGTPPRPFWLRFDNVKPNPPSGMPASGMPASGMPASGIPASGMPASGAASGPSSSAPRIASTGMSSIGADAAPASELGSPVIEIEAPVTFALKTVIPLPA